LIIQVERMRDGKRRITEITDLVGLEDDTPITQNIFEFRLHQDHEDNSSSDHSIASPANHSIEGEYVQTASINVSFLEKVRYAGLAKEFEQCMQGKP